ARSRGVVRIRCLSLLLRTWFSARRNWIWRWRSPALDVASASRRRLTRLGMGVSRAGAGVPAPVTTYLTPARGPRAGVRGRRAPAASAAEDRRRGSRDLLARADVTTPRG